MKRVCIFLIILCVVLTLCSCDALRMIKADPDALRNYIHPSDETYADTVMEDYRETEATYVYTEAEATTDTISEQELSELVPLEGELSFYTFENNRAKLVYNEKDAYIIDYLENKIIPICDYPAMLAAADTLGRGEDYFMNTALSVDVSENEHTNDAQIIFTVTSLDYDAYYKAYGFYTPLPGPSGQRRFYGINGLEIRYPGLEEPATIYDITDYSLLGIDEDYYLYDYAAALASGDFEKLAELLYLDSRVLDQWMGIKVGEYSISRTDFSPASAPSLYVYVEILESPLATLPSGKYNIVLEEGYSTPGFKVTRLDSDITPVEFAVSDINTVPGFAYTYSASFGGAYHPDEQNTENEAWRHDVLDMFSVTVNRNGGSYDYESFKRFCSDHFGIDASEVCGEKDFYNHGGHGLSTLLCKVSDHLYEGGMHTVTVDFFADPLYTVVAFTHTFTFKDEGDSFRLETVERTYDSGIRPKGWSL